jgi:hypothetical protein
MDNANLGVCFWITRTILITLFWLSSLSYYLFSRYMQLTDPGFAFFEAMPEIGAYFSTFVIVLAVIYLLWVVFLILLSIRKFGKMTPGNKFFLFLTLSTLLLVFIGLFASAFTPLLNPSGLFLSVFSITNLYIYILMIAYLPSERIKIEDWVNTAAAGSRSRDDDDETGGGRLRARDLAPVDTTGVMSAPSSGKAGAKPGKAHLPPKKGAVVVHSEDLDVTEDDIKLDDEEEGRSNSASAVAAKPAPQIKKQTSGKAKQVNFRDEDLEEEFHDDIPAPALRSSSAGRAKNTEFAIEEEA